jgi:hypothetical protein
MRRQIQTLGMTTLMAAALASAVSLAEASQQPNQKTPTALDVITVTGCVEKEADYRASIAEGKGGTLGTGAGVANEYVLRSAQTVSNDTLKPTGTSSGNVEDVYRLTGDPEHELGKAVGHTVALTGYVELTKSDGTEKVKDLGNFKIVGWHSVSDHCSSPLPKK